MVENSGIIEGDGERARKSERDGKSSERGRRVGNDVEGATKRESSE